MLKTSTIQFFNELEKLHLLSHHDVHVPVFFTKLEKFLCIQATRFPHLFFRQVKTGTKATTRRRIEEETRDHIINCLVR